MQSGNIIWTVFDVRPWSSELKTEKFLWRFLLSVVVGDYADLLVLGPCYFKPNRWRAIDPIDKCMLNGSTAGLLD